MMQLCGVFVVFLIVSMSYMLLILWLMTVISMMMDMLLRYFVVGVDIGTAIIMYVGVVVGCSAVVYHRYCVCVCTVVDVVVYIHCVTLYVDCVGVSCVYVVANIINITKQHQQNG